MIKNILLLATLTFIGCKTEHKAQIESKKTEAIINSQENFSKNVFIAFTKPDAKPITVPWLEIEIPLNGARLYDGKMLPSGKYNSLEDQGTLYIDFTKSTGISKINSEKKVNYFVAPMQFISDESANSLNALGYFKYNQVTQSITQVGGKKLPDEISNIELEDMISAVQVRYNKDGESLTTRYLANENSFTADHSQWITAILAKDYLESEAAKNTFIHKSYDLNADGLEESIVLITAFGYCGSGGCTMLVFGSDQKLINKMTVAKTPIQVMQSTTEGYNDLSVYSGGAQRLLKFDGKSYPTNPSMEPALAKNTAVEKVLIKDK